MLVRFLTILFSCTHTSRLSSACVRIDTLIAPQAFYRLSLLLARPLPIAPHAAYTPFISSQKSCLFVDGFTSWVSVWHVSMCVCVFCICLRFGMYACGWIAFVLVYVFVRLCACELCVSACKWQCICMASFFFLFFFHLSNFRLGEFVSEFICGAFVRTWPAKALLPVCAVFVFLH